MNLERCIGPDACPRPPVAGGMFCTVHQAAPAAKRGGWLSAEKRRQIRASSPVSSELDCSNVARRLWVGAKPPLERHLPEFDTLVLCAQEIQPTVLAFRGRVLRCPIPDAELTVRQVRLALEIGRATANDLHAGKTVLVTCAQGRNRSALVAGLAVGLVTYLSADQIVTLMRLRRRPDCLTNPAFRAILQRFIGAGRRPKKIEAPT